VNAAKKLKRKKRVVTENAEEAKPKPVADNDVEKKLEGAKTTPLPLVKKKQ